MFVPDLKASRSSSMDVPNLNPGPLGNQVSMGLGRFIEITSSTCLFVLVFLSLFFNHHVHLSLHSPLHLPKRLDFAQSKLV